MTEIISEKDSSDDFSCDLLDFIDNLEVSVFFRLDPIQEFLCCFLNNGNMRFQKFIMEGVRNNSSMVSPERTFSSRKTISQQWLHVIDYANFMIFVLAVQEVLNIGWISQEEQSLIAQIGNQDFLVGEILTGLFEVHKGVLMGFHAEVPVAEIAENWEEERAETLAFVGVDVEDWKENKGKEEISKEGEESEAEKFEDGK